MYFNRGELISRDSIRMPDKIAVGKRCRNIIYTINFIQLTYKVPRKSENRSSFQRTQNIFSGYLEKGLNLLGKIWLLLKIV